MNIMQLNMNKNSSGKVVASKERLLLLLAVFSFLRKVWIAAILFRYSRNLVFD